MVLTRKGQTTATEVDDGAGTVDSRRVRRRADE